MLLPRYYAEPNEFAGFHPMILRGPVLALNESSYCMTPLPEVMRPYKDLWGDFSDEFYTHENEYVLRGRRRERYIQFDQLFYQSNRYPLPLEKIVEQRLDRLRRTTRWSTAIAEYRSILDYLGSVEYERIF